MQCFQTDLVLKKILLLAHTFTPTHVITADFAAQILGTDNFIICESLYGPVLFTAPGQ